MNRETFFKRLKKIKGKWYLDGDSIRIRIRGRLHCPVSAVIGDRKTFSSPIESAWKWLRLKAAPIVSAADNRNLSQLRKKLLKATGLEEVKI